MRWVDCWIVLLASITLSQAIELKHLEGSMENSMNYHWQGLAGNSMDITCKMQGTEYFVHIWRRQCIFIHNQQPAIMDTNPTVQKNVQMEADPSCNETEEPCELVLVVSAKYVDELPPKHIHCRVTCCGYIEKPNATMTSTTFRPYHPHGSAAEEQTGVYKSQINLNVFLTDENIVWPETSPFWDTDPVKNLFTPVYEGECMDVNTARIVTVATHRTSYVEIIVFMMAGVSFLSVISTCVCVYMADDKTNQDKRRQFREWVKRRRNLNSVTGSSQPKYPSIDYRFNPPALSSS